MSFSTSVFPNSSLWAGVHLSYHQHAAEALHGANTFMRDREAQFIIDAMDNLLPLGHPTKIIQMGNTFNIRRWLLPQYVVLCEREMPLSTIEASHLDIEGLMGVVRIRERIRFDRGVGLGWASRPTYSGSSLSASSTIPLPTTLEMLRGEAYFANLFSDLPIP